jgi:hypothetical protein
LNRVSDFAFAASAGDRNTVIEDEVGDRANACHGGVCCLVFDLLVQGDIESDGMGLVPVKSVDCPACATDLEYRALPQGAFGSSTGWW